MLNKGQFIEYEAEKIKKILSPICDGEVTVMPIEVVKVNDQKLSGLSVKVNGSNVCPAIYLNDAFRDYISGGNLDVITAKLIAEIQEARELTPAKGDFADPKTLADKPIGLRLLQASRNKEFLNNVPYMYAASDLVLVCEVRVNSDMEGHYSTVVTNELLELMGKNKNEVFEQALTEAWDIDKPVLFDMEPALFGGERTNILDEGNDSESKMYVLSNTSGCYGAAALFYPDVQKKIYETLGENYYALPCSIEEFIIVPESLGIDERQFTDMVAGANSTVVRPEEVLGNMVLKYDCKAYRLIDVTVGKSLSDRLTEARC